MKTLTSYIAEAFEINEAYSSNILKKLFAKNPEFQKEFQKALMSDKSMAYTGTHKMYPRGGGDLNIKKSAQYGFLAIDALTDDSIEQIDVKAALRHSNRKGGDEYIRLWILPDDEVAFATWGNYLIDSNFRFSDKNMYDQSNPRIAKWVRNSIKYRNTDTQFNPTTALGKASSASMLLGGAEFKAWVTENVVKVYQIEIADMVYGATKQKQRAAVKQQEAEDIAKAAAEREEKLKLIKTRAACKRALEECLAADRMTGRGSGPTPILPCGVVNVKTGQNKYFNLFDEYQIDGVMYVMNDDDSGKLKYVLSSGVLLKKAKDWDFIHDQRRNNYLFSGTIVDIIPVVDFVKKYKSGNMYVFK